MNSETKKVHVVFFAIMALGLVSIADQIIGESGRQAIRDTAAQSLHYAEHPSTIPNPFGDDE